MEEITGRDETPEATHLLEVHSGEGQVFMDNLRARTLHNSVAQLLFTSTICRKDIQTAVVLLKTRVRAPDEYDRKKMRRLFKYVKYTIQLPLILSADNLNVIKWWVDASYAEHDDMRGHAGATIPLGRGLVLSMSKIKN